MNTLIEQTTEKTSLYLGCIIVVARSAEYIHTYLVSIMNEVAKMPLTCGFHVFDPKNILDTLLPESREYGWECRIYGVRSSISEEYRVCHKSKPEVLIQVRADASEKPKQREEQTLCHHCLILGWSAG